MTLPSGVTIQSLCSGTNSGISGAIKAKNASFNGSLGAGASASFGYAATGNSSPAPTGSAAPVPDPGDATAQRSVGPDRGFPHPRAGSTE